MTLARLPLLDRDNPHRRLIETIYGTRCARRSRVPLIDHINEGIIVLQALQATPVETEAFCLHAPAQISYHFGARPAAEHYLPIQPQGPRDTWLLQTQFPLATEAVALAWRFAAHAEAFRPDYLNNKKRPPLIAIDPAVRKLLIADKVQNRKDFDLFHCDSHPRRAQLRLYFECWFTLLDISEADYQRWAAKIDKG